jgi:hypothetical protein
LFEFDGDEISFRAGDVVLANNNSEDEWNAEGSADLTRSIGPGDAKVILYHRFENSPFISTSEEFASEVLLITDEFGQTIDETETIARTEYAIAQENGRTWELAAEYAYNTLDSESSFASVADGERSEEAFDPVFVEEARYQASLTHGRKIFGDLGTQLSLGAEYSEIQSETAGIAGEARSFFRPRGFLTLAYPLSEKAELRGRFERAVGQLAFGAFISSQNLREGLETEGNTDLVPQQSWDGEVEYERRFGQNEKLILRLQGSLIEDRVDQIVINGEQATGNIDEAWRAAVEAEGTLLFDRWGITGGRLDFSGWRQWSELEDPITGEMRPFSGSRRWNADFTFRHDIPNTQFAYGFGAFDFENEDGVTARQRSNFYISEPSTNAFVEFKDVFGHVLTLRAFNLLDQDDRFERTFYEGLREQSEIAFIEERSRDFKTIFAVNIAGTF